MNPKLNDTIVACATPAGFASIGIIRISGDQALHCIGGIFRSRQPESEIRSHHAYVGEIRTPTTNELIDCVVTTYFLAPHSYTGENVVEISCHGNPVIIDRIIQLLKDAGARLAQRGEFTKRALLNGKLDLLQAEAVLDTVYSPCDEVRRLAMEQYEGKLSGMVQSFRSRVIDMLTLIEASIDFYDEEDVQERIAGENDAPTLVESLDMMIAEVDMLLKNAHIAPKLKQGFTVLIMGRANVGKSTLFNRFVGYDRAIIHAKPGTTRDYLEEQVTLDGLLLRLFDTAGMINQPPATVDALAREKSLLLIENSDLIILMFDGSEALNEKDIHLYNLTKERKRIFVLNKIDLNQQMNDERILHDCIKLSAKTGTNYEILAQEIIKALQPLYPKDVPLLTRQRHVHAMETFHGYLVAAKNAPTPETQAFELHAALDTISELTGQVVRKDILDRIFDEFCIGK